MTCGAEGSRSLLAACLADGPNGPREVLGHVTVCDKHAQAVRRWLRGKSKDGQVQNVKTERLMLRWGQIVTPLDMPVWQPGLATGTGG